MTRPFTLPVQRPAGLRRPRPVTLALTRLDGIHPDDWSWEPFAEARHRFDPLNGAFRVRYAGDQDRVAARERYPERRIPAGDADVHLVTLRGNVRVLDLTDERVLDRLGLDDRISTGRLPVVRTADTPDVFLDACGRLAELVTAWWDNVHAIRFRSRTTPSGTNVAFCAVAQLETEVVRLADAADLLTRLVIADGFDVPAAWLL